MESKSDDFDWKLCARNRAATLANLIRLDAPDVLIGRSWHMLWEALTHAYGAKVFEEGQASRERIDDFIQRLN